MRSLARYLSPSSIGRTTLYNILGMLLGVGSGIIVARSLGPTNRGVLATAVMWMGLLQFASDFGLSFAFSWFAGRFPEKSDQLCTLAVILGIVLGCSFALIGSVILPRYIPALKSAPGVFDAALLSVPIILTSGFQAYMLLGRGFVQEHNLIRFVTQAANLVSAAVASYRGNVESFAIAFTFTQAIGLALSSWFVYRRIRPVPRFELSLLLDLFRYGIKVQLSGVAAQANLRADQAMMSVLLPPAQLGLYVVAVSSSGLLSPFLNAVATVVLPRTTSASSEKGGAVVAAGNAKRAALFSAPALLISVALMSWMIPFFFGKQFAPAILSARILAVAALFQGLNSILGNSLRGLGRPGLPALAEGAGMVVTLVLLVVLLPTAGISGAAVASLVAYVTVSFFEFACLMRTAGIGMREFVDMPIDLPRFGRSDVV